MNSEECEGEEILGEEMKEETILVKLRELLEEKPERYERILKIIRMSEKMGGYNSGKGEPSRWRSSIC